LVFDARGEAAEDRVLGRVPDGQDEREAKARDVRTVQRRESRELFRRKAVETSPGLPLRQKVTNEGHQESTSINDTDKNDECIGDQDQNFSARNDLRL
jgi:hypothetical protein